MNEIKVMTDFNHFFFFSYFNSIHFFVLQSMNSKRERERDDDCLSEKTNFIKNKIIEFLLIQIR